ncbi:MAG: hypothetical protein Q9195_009632 [Heterodermia aff. obscurata]
MSYIVEWFDKRMSLAYGFMSVSQQPPNISHTINMESGRCGTGGLSGAVLPPLYTFCLDRHGYKATLIGWSIASFVLTASGLLSITPRLPPTQAPKPKFSDFEFLQKPLFWILLTATAIQGLANYMPSLYLPSYAIDMGLSSAKGSLLASLLNLAQAIGQPLQGLLADYHNSFYPPMILSTLGSGVEALLIWGFSHTLWSLSLFAFLYGATAGGYAVLRPRFAAAIVANKEQSLLIYGILTAVRGAAVVASGFVASAQLDEGAKVTKGYGAHKWLRVVVYTGVTMVVASLGAVAVFVRPSWKFGRREENTMVGEDMSQHVIHITKKHSILCS